MKLDFYHNRIVADTITAEFEHSFKSCLIPLLEEKYGIIPEIQMYEDYIADIFLINGYWYYPLTLVTAGGEKTQWVRWLVNKTDFEDGIPYAFVGSGDISFELVNAPAEFERRLEGRARYSTGGSVKVRIETLGGDPTKLSGKYSQTFIDEMARQLTVAIESAAGVSGVANSSVELIMVFAPGTYMEHTSENRTYRRLMLIDKVSAPRDFWIQWTRLDGAVAYSVSSHVSAENILFELGEDVEQKIREREYRYLLTSGKEKYHNAMGRRKVTEWREVIKRAAKRGELTKIEADLELAPETLELEERIADLLGKRLSEKQEPVKEEIPYITPEDDEFARAMEKARLVVEQIAEEREEESFDAMADLPDEAEEEAVEFEEESDDVEEIDEFDEEIDELDEEIDEFDEEIDELDEEFEEDGELEESDYDLKDLSALDGVEDEPQTDSVEDRILDIFSDIIPETTESEEIQSSEPVVETPVEEKIIEEAPRVQEIPVIEERFIETEPQHTVKNVPTDSNHQQIEFNQDIFSIPTPGYYDTSLADLAADIRSQIETKIRLEYESRARLKAEQELIALRREQEKLKMEKDAFEAEAEKEIERLAREYEMLRLATKRAEQERAARDAQRRADEAKLREQIEAQLRQEAEYRERLEEAARLAIEEKQKLEAEYARMAKLREEEERREAEQRKREREEREFEALRLAELEHLRREEEEAKARARAAMPDMGDGKYSYTSKSVKFLFRKSVDPNITNRIYEIMKATVEYYGKDRVYLKVKATIPDNQTVVLDFEQIPIEEMELLGNIIKILGNSGLGIAKAVIE